MKATDKDRLGVQDAAVDRYISALKASHGKYARVTAETRQLVDESMGAVSLTDLLYKSREDGAK